MVAASCSSIKNSESSGAVRLTGQLKPLGMTAFQYGTHLLKTQTKLYALKSSTLKLNDYIDKSVTIKGTKVPGYPLEGGPELIQVSEITVNN